MTAKEAIDFINNEVQIDIRFCSIEKVDKTIEVFELAKSALEKQIPKKATEETINRGIDITGEYDIDFNLCCPVCGAVVGTFETGENEYFAKYCNDCGQALDWSDKDV